MKKKTYTVKHSRSRASRHSRSRSGSRSSRLAETRRLHRRRRFLYILLAGFALSVLVFAGVYFFMRSDGDGLGRSSGSDLSSDVSSVMVSVKDEAGNPGPFILLAASEGSFRAVSMSARTVAEVPGQGFLRLGQVAAAGDQALLDQTVANLLQHPVQYHIEIDHAMIQLASEQVGSFNLVLAQDLSLPVGDVAVTIPAGGYEVHSDQVVPLLRAAALDGNGPLVEAAVFQGLREAFLARSATDREAFAAQLYQRLGTDLDEEQFVRLFLAMTSSDQALTVEALPALLEGSGADWYFEPIAGEAANILGQIQESPYTLEVRNGTDVPGVVEWAVERLAPLGIDIDMQVETSSVNFEFTQIRYGSDVAQEGNNVRELLGSGTLIKDDYLENNQIIVIIGLDLAASAPRG